MEKTPISTQHVYGNRAVGKRVIRYLTKAGKDYKTALSKIANEHFNTPLTGNVIMRIDLMFPDKRRRDVDNYNKIILDALEGIAYLDDKQVQCLVVQKWMETKQGAIIVEVLPYTIENVLGVMI